MGLLLQEQLDSVRIEAPERTGLHAAAQDNLTMVRAYLSDGNSFLSGRDPVNALAAYCYGEGWLHFGAACGLLSVSSLRCLSGIPAGSLPPDVSSKLCEKTIRYERLLATARAAVRIAPEEGTALHGMAGRVTVVTGVYRERGGRCLARREYENALASFSYGHGWLDAAVRAGLYRICSDRDLFTL